MQLHFLGTGAGLPSKDRNVTSIVLDLLQERNVLWMFDCGEATQHQILHTSIKPRKIEKIFITHLHGDHIFGLPGLLSSRSFQGGEEPVTIYGPTGIKQFIETALTVSQSKLSYPIIIKELKEGVIFEDDQFLITVKKLEHAIDSFGFRIDEKNSPGPLLVEKLKEEGINPGPIYRQFKTEETVKLPNGNTVRSKDYIGMPKKGKSLAILGDTRVNQEIVSFIENVDLLVHEATFSKEQEELAYNYYHSTTAQAAKIAQKANVQELVLTHISSRFQQDQVDLLLSEAKRYFEKTVIAHDFYSTSVN
ncbi:ribonuclease Z [Gracilibacillus sp. D59]|uniref:ribonuclease Z n=1 Tax=Gracilibacillus sp. D59 TaxID=3457434 RepID=UPI003FCDE9A9